MQIGFGLSIATYRGGAVPVDPVVGWIIQAGDGVAVAVASPALPAAPIVTAGDGAATVN